MFTKHFWVDTAERCLSTFGQATLAALPTSYLPGVVIPFWAAFAAGGFGSLLCLLKCLAASRSGDGSASMVELAPGE